MTPPAYRMAVADDARLGALVESYGRGRLSIVRSAFVMGFLLLVGFEGFVSSLDGPGSRTAEGFVSGLLVGATACMAALAFALRLFASRGTLQLELREHGLVYRVRQAAVVVPWGDVAEVFVARRSIRRWKQDRCVLVTTDGQRVALTDRLRGIAQICSSVEEETVRRLVPGALEGLRTGRTATFGPFEVTKAGLVHASKVLEWKDVADVAVAWGQIIVGDCKLGIRVLPKRDSILAWAKAPYDEVPNAAVLLTLIQHLKGGRPPPS